MIPGWQSSFTEKPTNHCIVDAIVVLQPTIVLEQYLRPVEGKRPVLLEIRFYGWGTQITPRARTLRNIAVGASGTLTPLPPEGVSADTTRNQKHLQIIPTYQAPAQCFFPCYYSTRPKPCCGMLMVRFLNERVAWDDEARRDGRSKGTP